MIKDASVGLASPARAPVVNVGSASDDAKFGAGTPYFLMPAQRSDNDGDALTSKGVGNISGGPFGYEYGQIALVLDNGFAVPAPFDDKIAHPRGGNVTATVTARRSIWRRVRGWGRMIGCT